MESHEAGTHLAAPNASDGHPLVVVVRGNAVEEDTLDAVEVLGARNARGVGPQSSSLFEL